MLYERFICFEKIFWSDFSGCVSCGSFHVSNSRSEERKQNELRRLQNGDTAEEDVVILVFEYDDYVVSSKS